MLSLFEIDVLKIPEFRLLQIWQLQFVYAKQGIQNFGIRK